MRYIVKIGVFVLGIGGVLYWLVTLLARPATSLWARHRAKKEQLAEYYAGGDGEV